MKHHTRTFLFAILSLLAIFAAACANDDTTTATGGGGGGAASPGVSDTEIKFGMATPTSGTFSSLGIDGQKGGEVFVKWINDQGGVNGRKWKLVVQDDGFDLQKKVTAIQYLAQQEQVFAIWGDVGSQAVAALPVVNEQKIPYLFPFALAKQMIEPVQPYVFMDLPMADTQEHAFSDYLADNLKGDHKFGLLVLNSADGKDAVTGFKAGGAGKWVVAEQQYERTATSWEPQLVALKAAGVTDIMVHGSDTGTAKIMQEAKKQNLDVKFYTSSGSVTPQTFALAGNDLVEGTRAVAITTPSTHAATAGVKEFQDAFAKYEPGYKPGAYALHSWNSGKTVAAALKKVEGAPTRDKLVAALESMKDFDTKGVTAPLTFSKESHAGASKVVIVEAKNGEWVPVGDFVGPKSS